MKPHKIIGDYCALYGITMPEIDYSVTQFFVTISSGGASVLQLHEPSKLLGNVVCSAMKRGTVLYVNNGYARLITWENWKKTWAKLFDPKKRETAPEPNKSPAPYRSEIFEVMQTKRRPPKPQKHGFERTYTANKSMHLLGSVVG